MIQKSLEIFSLSFCDRIRFDRRAATGLFGMMLLFVALDFSSVAFLFLVLLEVALRFFETGGVGGATYTSGASAGRGGFGGIRQTDGGSLENDPRFLLFCLLASLSYSIRRSLQKLFGLTSFPLPWRRVLQSTRQNHWAQVL